MGPPGEPDTGSGQAAGPSSQRIDKWLWHVRLVKTRTMAASLVSGGHVRVGGKRIDKGYAVKRDDVVTVVVRSGVRILKVTGFSERRGDTLAAAALFEDLAPAPPKVVGAPEPVRELESGERDRGSGRPTKRDRRLTDRLKGV